MQQENFSLARITGPVSACDSPPWEVVVATLLVNWPVVSPGSAAGWLSHWPLVTLAQPASVHVQPALKLHATPPLLPASGCCAFPRQLPAPSGHHYDARCHPVLSANPVRSTKKSHWDRKNKTIPESCPKAEGKAALIVTWPSPEWWSPFSESKLHRLWNLWREADIWIWDKTDLHLGLELPHQFLRLSSLAVGMAQLYLHLV